MWLSLAAVVLAVVGAGPKATARGPVPAAGQGMRRVEAPPAPDSAEAAGGRHRLRDGLIALWQGDGSARDDVGSHNGQAGRGVGYTSDRQGRPQSAFLLTGRERFVRIPDHPALDADEAFTLSAWIQPAPGAGKLGLEQVIVRKFLCSTRHSGDYILELTRTEQPKLWVAHGDKTYRHDVLTSRAAVPLGRWTHLAATFDRGEMKLYVNGKLAASKTSTTVRHTDRREYEHDDVYIGAKWDGAYGFLGAIDEVAIWSRALSAAEVRLLAALTSLRATVVIAPAPHITRAPRSDRVLAADGSVLLGTIRAERYVVTTFFGRLELNAARVVGLIREGARDAPARVLLTDGQVLIGTLAAPTVRLEMRSGSTLAVPLSNIRQCAYRISEARPAGVRLSGPVLVLRGGHHLALAWAEAKDKPHLRLETEHGTVALPPEGVLGLELADPKDRTFRARFANGSVLTGRLRPEKVAFRLRLGPEAAVGAERILAIRGPGKAAPPAGNVTVAMRNGDRLLGRLADEKLAVRTLFGEAAVAPGDVRQMTFDAKQPGLAKIHLWDGTILSGRLAQARLAVAVVPGGPTVRARAERIAAVGRPADAMPPRLARRIEALVGQLGAEAYRDRAAAVEALVRMGRAIIPRLRKYADSPDPEVRQRVEEVLSRLGETGKPKPPPAPREYEGTWRYRPRLVRQ